MANNTVPKKIDLNKFNNVKAQLEEALNDKLEEEVELVIFESESDDDSDLWETPAVDSKTVIKLSPIVEEITGHKIKPEWIKPGGYDDVAEAVDSLMEQLELELKKNEG
ncbi:MAG: hypothetical protein OQJ89_02530 [Kangiellaceae bacterium]|nr:hypothetical protein [Kangiellaceae bacterium]MCW8997362.1 hypothetical protein [Kangiellaceae bacterium]MCW9015822.1 hypothetical protein [Kangiellaceae bacterium]